MFEHKRGDGHDMGQVRDGGALADLGGVDLAGEGEGTPESIRPRDQGLDGEDGPGTRVPAAPGRAARDTRGGCGRSDRAAQGARPLRLVSRADPRRPCQSSPAVPILHWLGALSFPLLLVLVTAAGTFSVPNASAAGTLLPEVVGEEEGSVAQAQAALQLASQTPGGAFF